jgi:hypothetical protein
MFGIDTKYGQILKSAEIVFAIAIVVLLRWSLGKIVMFRWVEKMACYSKRGRMSFG